MQNINSAQTGGNLPTEKSKHEQLQDAINELYIVQRRLECLASKIECQVESVEPDKPGPMLTLAGFLDAGKDQVRTIGSDMDQTIDRIEKMLF